MCRLTAITATDIPPQVKAFMLNDLMLRGNADDAQHDGWGIATEHEILRKSALSYWSSSPDSWMPRAEQLSSLVIGHVRKASLNTHRTLLESHPYEFEVEGGSRLTIAHNGLILGFPYIYNTGTAAEPNTDTFRAAKVLAETLQHLSAVNPNQGVDKEVVESWASQFTTGSAYVFMIMYRGRLVVVRGPATRTMHLAQLGNGYVLHTSKEAIAAFGGLAATYGYPIGEIYAMKEHTVLTFSPGSLDYGYEGIAPSYRAYTVYKKNDDGAGNGSKADARTQLYLPAPKGNGAIGFSVRDDEDEEEARLARYWQRSNRHRSHSSDDGPEDPYAHSTYRPRWEFHRLSRDERAALDRARQDEVAQLHAVLNPMRTSLIGYWLAEHFSVKTRFGTTSQLPDIACIKYLDPVDLQEFKQLTVDKSGDPRSGLTPRQRWLVNTWNTIVGRHEEFRCLLRFTEHFDYFWMRADLSDETFKQYVRIVQANTKVIV